MIRVLHFTDPEGAGRRIAFLGASGADADRLLAGLRCFLVSVPMANGTTPRLLSLLDRMGIPHARGRDVVLLSFSSLSQLGPGGDGSPGAEDILLPVREAVLRWANRDYTLGCGDRSLSLSGVPRIMGVLNVTPDSFSDGGLYLSFERAVERGVEMTREGADIVDVGGESTRPGSKPVPAEKELARVIPVIRALAERTDAILSVDTSKADVAAQAVAAGARIVNDTSALADDPRMAQVVRDSGCGVVLMHRRGVPETMQDSPSYRSLFDEILDELADRVAAAEKMGIPGDRILVDPGVGFGKRIEDNLALHRHVADLRNLGKPVLFGPSRKAFLGKITGREPSDRAAGTAASVAMAVMGGAHVLRVHDVREMRDAVLVASAVAGGVEC